MHDQGEGGWLRSRKIRRAPEARHKVDHGGRVWAGSRVPRGNSKLLLRLMPETACVGARADPRPASDGNPGTVLLSSVVKRYSVFSSESRNRIGTDGLETVSSTLCLL